MGYKPLTQTYQGEQTCERGTVRVFDGEREERKRRRQGRADWLFQTSDDEEEELGALDLGRPLLRLLLLPLLLLCHSDDSYIPCRLLLLLLLAPPPREQLLQSIFTTTSLLLVVLLRRRLCTHASQAFRWCSFEDYSNPNLKRKKASSCNLLQSWHLPYTLNPRPFRLRLYEMPLCYLH